MINTLGNYVSVKVRDFILKSDNKKLAVRMQYGVILICDLRNFTNMMEETDDTKSLIKQLNDYFSAMVSIISNKGGFISKFVGDAIIGVFGGFDEQDTSRSEDTALETAVLMTKKLDELNAEWKKKNKKTFKMGIGLDSGNFIIGSIGSRNRMEFSCIGEVVSNAQEIESMTKLYNCNILMAERFADKLTKDKIKLKIINDNNNMHMPVYAYVEGLYK